MEQYRNPTENSAIDFMLTIEPLEMAASHTASLSSAWKSRKPGEPYSGGADEQYGVSGVHPFPASLQEKKRALAQAGAARELEKMTFRTADETKSKAAFARDLADRDNLARLDETDQLRGVKISQLQRVDSFDPGYEFD